MNDFVPNEDVNKYFQLSDAILLYYLYATPSGVESIAYNFKLPILATSVGHFPETVKDGYNGYLAEPEDIDSMAAAMEKIITHPIPGENIEESSKEMSWNNYASAILAN
jgi:glycosyltransferase involved in cell wall biosynthesis